MVKRSFLFVILIIVSTTLFSQTFHRFEKGLFLLLDLKYGRDAIVRDPLAYQLYNNTLTYPSGEGSTFSASGEMRAWKKVATDSSGNFQGESLSEGYLYLSYSSQEERTAILNVSGHNMAFVNGTPYGGDIYKYGWLYSPVELKRGDNHILIRCSRWARWQGVAARLIFPESPVTIRTEDTTLPHIIPGLDNSKLLGAVVVTNASKNELKDYVLTSRLDGKELSIAVPPIPPMTSRKVPFRFNADGISKKGSYMCALKLTNKSTIVHEQEIEVEAVNNGDHYSCTFISGIDGSIQYYGVTPQSGTSTSSPALFLSVHGAGVEAIGQARAYQSKDWGVLVAPTNRRPRGFNWEDWGRIDALEVLQLATKKFNPDPARIYLTGHSMGGHGTWYLGATYPDKWAAIAPCAGYPTLAGYGSSDGKIPEEAQSKVEKTLLRASNASNVVALARNYGDLGVYIHHGDSDKVVSVNYARQMREVLGAFHSDFSYYEYPGGSHWFGSESVDWPPLFDFFKWHTIKQDSAFDKLDFITPSPAISSRYRWASVIQQQQPLEYSEIHLTRNKKSATITGSTKNVALLKLEMTGFDPGDTISISLDAAQVKHIATQGQHLYLSGYPNWTKTAEPDPKEKNDVRGGTFKEAFNHNMIFVYGTSGNAAENKWSYQKARYDAEVWYYRGNGAVDILPDHEFAPKKYRDRGVILYGNAATNSAWTKLLKDCPIQVTRGRITIGSRTYEGGDLGAYFTWPRQDSDIALVGVITGTGLRGMNATEANQYFAAGSGFPDYMIFSLDMLKSGATGIKEAGFYDNKWRIP